MSDYTVNTPLLHDGKGYAPGSTLPGDAITPEQVETLLNKGSLSKIALPSNVTQLQTPPDDPVARVAAITSAIGLLDDADRTLWTSDRKPDARALTQALGWKVSAAERDAAWDVLQAEQG